MEILPWLLSTEYGPYLLAFLTVLGALVTAASAIVPFTTTTKDDEFVGKVKALLAKFSVFQPKA
jgi:hypothetical protein